MTLTFKITFLKKYAFVWQGCIKLIKKRQYLHLADAFIQSDLQFQSGYTFSLVCVFPGNRTHSLLRCWCNDLPLSHRNTTLQYLYCYKRFSNKYTVFLNFQFIKESYRPNGSHTSLSTIFNCDNNRNVSLATNLNIRMNILTLKRNNRTLTSQRKTLEQ